MEIKEIRSEERDGFEITHIMVQGAWDMGASTFVGADPGTRNMGVARLGPRGSAKVAQIRLPKFESDYSDTIKRIKQAEMAISYGLIWFSGGSRACVEGASYADRYRQVELAEHRAGLAYRLSRYMPTIVVPPKTIRKKVFGNGKIKAKDEWPEVAEHAPDGVAALACAMFAEMYHREEVENG